MANSVSIEFIGDPQDLFQTVAAVEKRLADLRKQYIDAARAPNPVIRQQQELARSVKTTSATMATDFAKAETAAAGLNRQLREMARNGGSIPEPPTPIVLQRAQAAAGRMTPEQAAANDARMQEVREQMAARRIERQQEREFRAMRGGIERQDQLRASEARSHALRVNARRAAADQMIALEQRETAAVVRESATRRRSLLESGAPRRTAISALAMYAGRNVPGVPEGVGAFEMSRLAGLSTVGAGAVGLAAGLAAREVERATKAARERLAEEERIGAAHNDQMLTLQRLTVEADKLRQIASERRQIDLEITRDARSLTALTERQARLMAERQPLPQRAMIDAAITGKPIDNKRLIEIDRQLSLLDPMIEDARRRRTGFMTDEIEANRRFFAERAQREREWQEQVKQGQDRVKELGQTWREAFTSLTAQANRDNPIVKVFQDADKAMRELRENVKGLPKELQRAAIQSQQAFNASQLFGARVDSALSAVNLRDMAARFRDDTADRRRFSEDVLARDRAEFERRQGLGENFNVDAVRESLNQRERFINLRFREETPSERLDRQIEAIRRISPADDAQRAIADQRILNLASGLDPNDLRRDQRESIAQIADRAAEREERRFKDAQKIQQNQERFLRSIDENIQKFLQKAARGGVQAVQQAVDITVRDETGSARIERRASAEDTADYYAGTLLTSGPGGLTNR
ncbi:MAG TPA: hypothetical protein PKD24_05695 [Pyrinomonadaceae bacterium]|nr:hypothetical protein [Pyrinomonadaceae bacterium]HMP65044.1 hypothetical protein [Pyrinomonadaceae bacterium]